jgi:hypothetical protein
MASNNGFGASFDKIQDWKGSLKKAEMLVV